MDTFCACFHTPHMCCCTSSALVIRHPPLSPSQPHHCQIHSLLIQPRSSSHSITTARHRAGYVLAVKQCGDRAVRLACFPRRNSARMTRCSITAIDIHGSHVELRWGSWLLRFHDPRAVAHYPGVELAVRRTCLGQAPSRRTLPSGF